jgi:hypothetical protein
MKLIIFENESKHELENKIFSCLPDLMNFLNENYGYENVECVKFNLHKNVTIKDTFENDKDEHISEVIILLNK